MSKGRILQWAPTTPEAAEAAESFEYFRVDDSVVLIYASKRHELFADADDQFTLSMTPDELAWLKECIESAARKQSTKQLQKAYENDKAFMEMFEKELAKEKERIERKEDVPDGYSEKTGECRD